MTLLAADVGGTHARLGILRSSPGTGRASVLAYHKYHCADHASLGDIARNFLAAHDGIPVTRGVLACSGCVVDGVVINDTLPWKVVIADLRQAVQLENLAFINDFEALAHAMRRIDPATTTPVVNPSCMPSGGTQVVVGPGTGLGAAVLASTPHGTIVLPTEAGQAALAPVNRLESDMLHVLSASGEHVPWEHVLSGPGLLNVYRALCTLHEVNLRHDSPEAVTTAALADKDPQARQTLEVFCAMLGSFVGDLAMFYNASGGIWLAGGILPSMRHFLLHSRFTERFLGKGHMRAFLGQVPVRLIEHGQLGLTGAVDWYLEHGA